jgi:two-component system cell cycle sensor histidine kinase/response regulator CckA
MKGKSRFWKNRTSNEDKQLNPLQIQSELAAAQYRIEESENNFHILFKHSASGLAAADTLTRRFVIANPSICHMLGYSEEEFITMRVEDLHPPEERERILDLFKKLARGEIESTPKVPVLRKNGSVFQAEIDAFPIIINGQTCQMGTFRDMTRDNMANEALRESRQVFSTVFNKSPISIFITRLSNNNFIDANTAFLALTGLNRNEVIDRSPNELNLWENEEEWDRIVQQICNRKTISSIETKLREKTGKIVDILLSSELIELDGDPCMLSMALNISERKRTMEDLRQRIDLQDQIANINATVPGMIYSFKMNPDGTTSVPYTNAKIYELWGLHPEEVAEDFSPGLARIHPADISHVWESISESARTLKPWRNEFRVRHPEKGERWIDGFSLPKRQADGSILWHGFAYDITDNKRAQERLRRFIMAGPAVLYVLEAKENRLQITWVSENLYPVVGWTPAEALEKTSWWQDNIHPEDRDRIAEQHPFPYRKDHQVLEYRLRRKDGTYLWIRDEKRLLRGIEGRSDEIVGAWVDISERIQLEAQLQQSQKMEAIGQLAGGIAHDFNNILTTILGYSSLVLSEMPPENPHRVYIADIKDAGERATVLTRQLLAFGRRQELNPKVTDLRLVVQGIEKMLRRLIGEDVTLVTTFSPEIPWVKVDPGQMEQVIINLAVNARDAMPEGGMLTIEIRPCELDEDYCSRHTGSKPGNYAMLSITDTGAGIPPEIMDRIFEPFFTTKEIGKGTGLGLSTVFGIVKQSGGSIEIYSEVDAGTCFKVYLPAHDSEAKTASHDSGMVQIPGGNETILVVEDEAGVRKSVVSALSNHGYNVIEARDGLMALTAAEESERTIDLLLSDLIMPHSNGLQLAENLRSQHPGMKILFMSGYTDNRLIRENDSPADTDYIPKPFSSLELVDKVRRVLDGSL